MIRLFFFCLAAVWVLGLMLPDEDAPAALAPVRATTPSEPPRETLLERAGNGHFYVHAKVNGQLVRFMVDTGASPVALTIEDARRVGVPVDPANFEIVGEGASGLVRGQNVTLGSVEIDGKLANDVSGVVMEGGGQSLLGQAYLSRLTEVRMSGETMVLR